MEQILVGKKERDRSDVHPSETLLQTCLEVVTSYYYMKKRERDSYPGHAYQSHLIGSEDFLELEKVHNRELHVCIEASDKPG